MTQTLPLSSIISRPYLQQRSSHLIDDEYDLQRQQANLFSTIDTIKTALGNGQSIRIPLEVHEVNKEYLLVDGHHRYEGALAHCKAATIAPHSFEMPVNITKNSTEKAAIDASFKANLDHGVGLMPSELKHLHFKRYVWTRLVPKISEIRSDTCCAKGTASNIASAARWCINSIESKGADTATPTMLKLFMTQQMEGLGISSNYLDNFGLPTYSLLTKALKSGGILPEEVKDSREEHIRAVREKLGLIESEYGVDVFREGLRKHRTKAHGISITLNSKWIEEPTTATLLSIPLIQYDDF
jgi:hypothetical protein